MSDEPYQQGWAPRDPSVLVPTISRFPSGQKGGRGGRTRKGEPGGSPGSGGSGANGPGNPGGPGKRNRPKRPRHPGAPRRPHDPNDPNSPHRTGLRRILPTWRTVLGATLISTLLLMAALIIGYQIVGIPPANAQATAQSNLYLYADGTQLARDGEVNRENIRLSQVPKSVQQAVLAAEDRDFYHEHAVDLQGMTRAFWNTLTGKGTQGGSTITQQYVKNYYLGQEQTVVRKSKELFIAIKLNREQSKESILQGYLNTSYFGRNAYGIQAAAQAYYGKDIERISVAEGAYLAALLNQPSEYDIAVHPENRPAAKARWNYVLDGMVKEGWLGQADRAALKFPVPGKIRHASGGLSGQRGYIVQAVEDYLTSNKIMDENTLAAGGHRITTTLERSKQDALDKAVDDHVLSRLDTDERDADRNVRVGGVSIDPSTGRVVAMYGGVDYTQQYVNNATRRDYQVGSTFKPFVLAAAIEHQSRTRYGETITPSTVYDGDNEREVEGPEGPIDYAPANEDDISYGPISVREATDKSVNAVYAQMAEDVGPATVKETAIALGVPENTPDLTPSPSIALGPATASVLDMAKAYATLANHGRHGTYTLVDKISRNGKDVGLPGRSTEQVISREAADTTTAVLRGVVEGGTGTAALSAGRPSAGKTGTAEDDKAAWFAGYTPDLTTVIAMMGADPKTAAQKPLYGALGQTRINGGGPPAEIWGQFTADVLKGTQAKDFDLRTEEGSDRFSTSEDSPDSPDSPVSSDSADGFRKDEAGDGPLLDPEDEALKLGPFSYQDRSDGRSPGRPGGLAHGGEGGYPGQSYGRSHGPGLSYGPGLGQGQSQVPSQGLAAPFGGSADSGQGDTEDGRPGRTNSYGWGTGSSPASRRIPGLDW
ncbi:transglycosylase domain-containing protein [Streptomyces sp. NPDC001840]